MSSLVINYEFICSSIKRFAYVDRNLYATDRKSQRMLLGSAATGAGNAVGNEIYWASLFANDNRLTMMMR